MNFMLTMLLYCNVTSLIKDKDIIKQPQLDSIIVRDVVVDVLVKPIYRILYSVNF